MCVRRVIEVCDLAVGLAGVKGGMEEWGRGMDVWRALLLYVGRLIASMHAYMYGNVWHFVVKRNTSDCVCGWEHILLL